MPALTLKRSEVIPVSQKDVRGLGLCGLVLVCLASLLVALPVSAQQITGVPGSPSATITIDGRQIPAPPQKFEGKIERNAAQAKPYWPARIVPPKGAPNVLLIMTDDVGYGAPSTFGGVIPTPALDRIAKNGPRFTNFHATIGRIHKVTLTIDRPKLTPDDEGRLMEAQRNDKTSKEQKLSRCHSHPAPVAVDKESTQLCLQGG
jgi:hypothetical protein